MNGFRRLVLLCLLCLPLAWPVFVQAGDACHGAATVMAAGCCGGSAHQTSDTACTSAACAIPCLAPLAPGATGFAEPGAWGGVLVSAPVHPPRDAPLFREQRPPRSPA
ncbi:hypothetical protein G3580_03775 [Nitrogeniibacter mangrovi]|uniref:Uncharacterized protein n=1 Tax=Nitrogeniibacter mangrovi TaxID=2016596 RepID=A0A6C1AZN7_9RHOO|nr:hypothetical protein [Nitrogeniibacter mangrovi]QID16831.1 hypothetical protein G3580_03775 [Nitrogeniibacter mangrovi]